MTIRIMTPLIWVWLQWSRIYFQNLGTLLFMFASIMQS